MSMLSALKKRFATPAYAFFSEVRDTTGANAGRSADAMAFGLYPSRGLHVVGIEIKSNRADWLRELKKPAKAEVICAYCTHWYLAVTDASIVKDEELPATWGLLILDEKGDALKQAKAAPQLTAKPMTQGFVASIMRRFYEDQQQYVHINSISEALNKSYADGRTAAQRQSDHYQACLEKMAKQVQEFTSATGISPLGRDGIERIKQALALLKADNAGAMSKGLNDDLDCLIRKAHSIQDWAMQAKCAIASAEKSPQSTTQRPQQRPE